MLSSCVLWRSLPDLILDKYIEYLYDVTVGYGDAIVQSEVELVTHGLAPNDIHYQVR